MRHLFSRLLVLGLLCAFVAPASAAAPQAGDAAPAFRLQDQNGHWRTPADFHGHWLVLYFYPKDFTPGCTTEVCTFRDDIAKLRKAGAEVVGVSLDDVKSHAEFAAKYHVPFPLLSDADRSVATAYGVLSSHLGMHYARRTTFLVDPQGKVAKVYVDVDPEKNSAQVLGDLTGLKAAR
ncbi:peroxiredoxin [Rhodanobacter sp. FW510-R12]|uniref:peroxiredoxin n=1 Tax=unclassified Rhodanobacter TaxID=2621553 RepID=UPI0007A9E8ED|nr:MULTISPECIES: peroxiredoxin [unclassified Rhodanobacter]KZC17717.1 peroxiredoxin [Rhodanobacter sp. FW104-R8]KZC27978.1 peroxiredoxin [Rhodanobacter sp. FW510-T8]KZC29919.1 peroxiredoxin [Rhodanobacter sp. FW510-R10]